MLIEEMDFPPDLVQAKSLLEKIQELLFNSLQEIKNLFNGMVKCSYGKEFREFVEKNYVWAKYKCFDLQFFHLRFDRVKELKVLVLRREFLYFLIGVLTGTIIGYTATLKRNPQRHMHSMKAVVCHNFLGVRGVTLIEDAEMPTILRPNDLLIQVKAASLNEVDLLICSGYSKTYRRLLNSGRQRDLPVTLGRASAGVIVDIGPNVVNFDIGDKVFLSVPSWATGTMSEYVSVSENQVAKMPKNLSFEACATFPYSGCIAWNALKNVIIKEKFAKGKRILVLEGSTSIGCILIQLIKVWGSYVVTTGKKETSPILKALGADEVIDVDEHDLLKELDLQDKFDAIFHTGGVILQRNILKKHLSYYGSYISTVPEYLISDHLGSVCGSIFSACVNLCLFVQFIFGLNGNWKEGSKINTAYLQSLQKLADMNQLQPILDRVYGLDSIDQALTHITEGNTIGSTVIKF